MDLSDCLPAIPDSNCRVERWWWSEIPQVNKYVGLGWAGWEGTTDTVECTT